jgi:hypothetical protein
MFEIFSKAKAHSEDIIRTEVFVTNNTDDTITAYLTLGADTNYVTDVNGIFGISTSGLQGSFTLLPNDTLKYKSPKGKGFNGNISFGTAPVNCFTNDYPEGINIFEFALNNDFKGIPNAQETFDISCVAGVNSRISCFMSSKDWNDGDSTGFTFIENSFLYDNYNRIGVFPYGCDSCSVIYQPPVCENHAKYAEPQPKNMCNVQRDATKKGGYIVVSFNGFLKGEPCNK